MALNKLSSETFADFVLFYCNEDKEEAKIFKERIEREAAGISGHMYNQLHPQSVDVPSIEEMCNRGVQTWFYI